MYTLWIFYIYSIINKNLFWKRSKGGEVTSDRETRKVCHHGQQDSFVSARWWQLTEELPWGSIAASGSQGKKNLAPIHHICPGHKSGQECGIPELRSSQLTLIPLCHMNSPWHKGHLCWCWERCGDSGVREHHRPGKGQEYYKRWKQTKEHLGSWPKSAGSNLSHSLSMQSVVWGVLEGKF